MKAVEKFGDPNYVAVADDKELNLYKVCFSIELFIFVVSSEDVIIFFLLFRTCNGHFGNSLNFKIRIRSKIISLMLIINAAER